MARATKQLIELVYTKEGKAFFRVDRALWDRIKGSENKPAGNDTHVDLDWDIEMFGKFDEEVALPVWGPVDTDCDCLPIEGHGSPQE
jgi:hypothetical protein